MRALVIRPYLKSDAIVADRAENRLEETVGLSRALDLGVQRALLLPVSRIVPATWIGKGAVESIGLEVKIAEAKLVVMDCTLSPGQQRNLERRWHCKVIDRTALILEILGERAQTSEGRLQVELAHLTWQRSRLVRSWTHLERQRGGFGFMGGPGESQIELDRRLIDERIAKLKRNLETVRTRRALQQQAREKVPYPIVALVGYTNAGKSTLFNRLTSAGVMAEDLLFTTLDPTMRKVRLPKGREIILSDTVGFISDLPTELVAGFRATLEEVERADVILHVRDIARSDTEAQAESVRDVMESLVSEKDLENRLIEVWNKLDALSVDEQERYENQAERSDGRYFLTSALTGVGVSLLAEAIETRLGKTRRRMAVIIPHDQGTALSWLYDHGTVVERRDEEGGTKLTVDIEQSDAQKLERRYGLSVSSNFGTVA